jgi:hypothetical protein
MKAIIVLVALFALAACDYHHTYAEYLDMQDFIQGTWYFNGTVGGTDTDFKGCCVPTGIITISNDTTNSSQLLLNATAWNGTLCDILGLNTNTSMLLPFAGNSTYSNITATNTFGPQGIEYDFGLLTVGNYTPANDSDLLTISLDFEFAYVNTSNYTSSCYIYYQKSGSMIKVAGAIVASVVAFFAF